MLVEQPQNHPLYLFKDHMMPGLRLGHPTYHLPEPLRFVGRVEQPAQGTDDSTFLGTCFALRSPLTYVTAAHCVRGVDPTGLQVVLPSQGPPYRIDEVRVHPKADVAVLLVGPGQVGLGGWNFQSAGAYGIGEDVAAYGHADYPLTQEGERLPGRLFKGHIQRVFNYESFNGYSYIASELNFACPEGLSGAPVFRHGLPVALGLVTGNIDSHVIVDRYEEHQRDGVIERGATERIVSFGVALMLDGIDTWLNENIPGTAKT